MTPYEVQKITCLRKLVIWALDDIFENAGFFPFGEPFDFEDRAADRAAIDFAIQASNVAEGALFEFYGKLSYLQWLLHDILATRDQSGSYAPSQEEILSEIDEAAFRLWGVNLRLYAALRALENRQSNRPQPRR